MIKPLNGFLLLLMTGFLAACNKMPSGIEPVSDFDINRYMGQWFEIARLDHRFERGLQQVSATYTLADDGFVTVLNRGFDVNKQQWRQAEGKAKFATEPSFGHLKVSFFGPFYGTYMIFELEPEAYQYAFVTGGNDYLWLLARSPVVNDTVKQRFLQLAAAHGFATNELIFVSHD